MKHPILILAIFTAALAGCKDSEPKLSEPSDTKEIEMVDFKTIIDYIGIIDDKYTIDSTIYISNGNFEGKNSTQFYIVGKINNLGYVTKIPNNNTEWESSVAVKVGYGYVARTGFSLKYNYYRFFVAKKGQGIDPMEFGMIPNDPYFKFPSYIVRYQFPFIAE